MLQIKEICKEYRTGSLVQKALDKVSLNLRDNEFVAILRTVVRENDAVKNVIGGLDRYDGGDLIINGISTRRNTKTGTGIRIGITRSVLCFKVII